MPGMVETNKDVTVRYGESFLCGGTSALLISIAHLHSNCWFVSLFALVPFLWQATRVSIRESVVLGVLLATSYSFVTMDVAPWATPGPFLLKLFSLNILFALYGTVVNRLAKRVGFNAVFIAVFWLPLEYVLRQYAHLSSIFTFSETDSTFFIRIGSLFGTLMVSFVVVLINSLIVVVSEHIVRALYSNATSPVENDERFYEEYWEYKLEKLWYYFTDSRAPPAFSSVTV